MRPRLPPAALLMGLANLPFGLAGALALVATPQLLAARGVPQPTISSITAVALIPSFAGFLLAPLIDVRFSRRTYAWILGAAMAMLAVTALANIDRLNRYGPLLMAMMAAAGLFNIAVGGWLGDIVAKGDEGRLAAGFQIGNIGGFGVGAILFATLLRALPGAAGQLAAGAIIAAPLTLLAVIPVSHRDRVGLHESFAALRRDLLILVKQPVVRRALFLFVWPTCGFAMSNTLTGLGPLYGASEQFVSLVAGLLVTGLGVVCSLAVAPLVKRVPPGWLFLGVGAVGAAFTAAFAILPHTPMVLAVGIGGENGLQAFAFAVASTIIFRSIGDDNPLAATQYAMLTAAMALPTTYMQWVDGRAYAAGNLDAALLTDAGLALAGAIVLAPVVRAWRRRGEHAF